MTLVTVFQDMIVAILFLWSVILYRQNLTPLFTAYITVTLLRVVCMHMTVLPPVNARTDSMTVMSLLFIAAVYVPLTLVGVVQMLTIIDVFLGTLLSFFVFCTNKQVALFFAVALTNEQISNLNNNIVYNKTMLVLSQQSVPNRRTLVAYKKLQTRKVGLRNRTDSLIKDLTRCTDSLCIETLSRELHQVSQELNRVTDSIERFDDHYWFYEYTETEGDLEL
jgi:hypothetical protein